ncbi:putative ferredoxin [Candidatus Terasakiella magnetica]|uniref:Putative ferredoxin n=1 Tax=Candidatus Terasakiella magnetica TaxID=1867952 RepID=A0A1C3RFF5_9PROT|nr:Rieske 2Fe-2S domain-containing protein [Candidatus Terasakiella magnetica]SCA56017.1 putative ferredoxin [Candidatus Terasakiella magnetica]
MEWKKHPFAPRTGETLCHINELEDGNVTPFSFGEGKEAFSMVVYKREEMIRAYWNLCPHFRIPLNKPGGGILLYNDVLWCVHHSAEFRVEDGHCFSGPCQSGALERIDLEQIDGELKIV